MELFAIILIGLIAFLFGWLSGARFIHANATANINEFKDRIISEYKAFGDKWEAAAQVRIDELEDLQRQIADLTKTVNEQKDKANGC